MKTGKILLTALASLALSTAAYAADGNGTEKRNVYLADWTPQNPKAGEAIYINLTQPNPYGQGVHTTNEFIYFLDNSGLPEIVLFRAELYAYLDEAELYIVAYCLDGLSQ